MNKEHAEIERRIRAELAQQIRTAAQRKALGQYIYTEAERWGMKEAARIVEGRPGL